MSSTLDDKISVLWEKYSDSALVQSLMDDVEHIWRKATYVGISTTAILFAFNEYSRFAFWSPLFKLTPINTVLLLAAPTFLARYFFNEDTENRVKNLFRIHKNREAKGMQGTY